MDTIIFGADGTLYLQNSPDSPMISMKSIFRFSEKTFPGRDLAIDYKFWAKHLTKDVIFEFGLTMKTFMQCLMPWKDFFSHQTQVNLIEYWEEMSKPVDPESNCYQVVDYIMLYENVSFYPARSEDLFKSKRFSPVPPELEYEVSTGFFLSGFKIDAEMPQDLSHIPMQYIADIPVILQHERSVQFGDWLKREDSKVKETIEFPVNAYGVRKTIDNEHFLLGYSDSISLEVMLRSFFRYIFRDINKRDNGTRIRLEIQEKEKGADIISFPSQNKVKANDKKTVKETVEEVDNVIEVPFKQMAREKKFFDTLESTLVQRLMEERVLEEALIAYEKKHNPNARITGASIIIGVPPEPRVSNIGIEDFPEEE